MHCSMTIVLPNGEVMKTGMGAMQGKNAEGSRYLFPYGYGPCMLSLERFCEPL